MKKIFLALLILIVGFFGEVHAQSVQSKLIISRDAGHRVQSITFPKGQKIQYQYDNSGKISSKKFENFRIYSNKPKTFSVSSDRNNDYNLAVVKEFSMNLPSIPSMENILNTSIPDHSSNAIQTRFYSAYFLWGSLKMNIIQIKNELYGEPLDASIVRRDFIKLFGVDIEKAPSNKYAAWTNSLLKDARKVRENYRNFLKIKNSKNMVIDSKNPKTTKSFQRLSNIIKEIKNCNPMVGKEFESKLVSKKFIFDYQTTQYLNGETTKTGSYFLFKVQQVPGQYENIIFSDAILTDTDQEISKKHYLLYKTHEKRAWIKSQYFGDSNFNPDNIGNQDYTWINLSLVHEFGHTLLYNVKDAEYLSKSMELYFVANAKYGIKNVDPRVVEKLKALDEKFSAVNESTAQYFAMDAMVSFM